MHRIPARITPAIVEFAFGDLANRPLRVGKPLNRELTGLFGARRGPYRLLYRMDDETLWVYIVHCGAPRGRRPPSLNRAVTLRAAPPAGSSAQWRPAGGRRTR